MQRSSLNWVSCSLVDDLNVEFEAFLKEMPAPLISDASTSAALRSNYMNLVTVNGLNGVEMYTQWRYRRGKAEAQSRWNGPTLRKEL